MLRFGCSRPKLAGHARFSFCAWFSATCIGWQEGYCHSYPSPLFTSSSATTALLDGRVAGIFVQRRLSGLRKGLSDGIVGVLLALGFGHV